MHKPLELNVMNWPLSSLWGKSLKEAVSDPFTEITGIKIRHIENRGTDHPPELLKALQNKKRPPFDVIYGNTIPALKMALDGHCESLTNDNFPNINDISKRALPKFDNIEGYPVIIAYIVRYVLMYRLKAFPEKKPESWSILLNPEYKGRVSIYPGGKGFFPVAQVMGGGKIADMPHNMSFCWDFLHQLKENIGPMGYNKAMEDKIRQEEVDLFFTVLTNIRQWKADGYGVSWVVPKEGIVDGDDSLNIPKFLPDNVVYWAKKYIEFALTKEVQKDWCHRLGLCPVYKGIEKPEDLINDPAYPESAEDMQNTLHIDNSILAKYEHDLWKVQFNKIFEINE